MKLRDILAKYASGEFDYGKAQAELRHLPLDEDTREEAELTLYKMRDLLKDSSSIKSSFDREDELNHHMPMLLGFVPNEHVDQIMFETTVRIQEGELAEMITDDLIENYRLSPVLAAYFFSEAERRVRLKTLNQEEFDLVGEQWMTLQTEKTKQQFIEDLKKFTLVPVAKKTKEAADE